MNDTPIRRIAVVGAGLMGHGIALEFAAAGYDVALSDVSEAKLDEARARIATDLSMLAGLGLLAAEAAEAAPARMQLSTSLESVAGEADLVIEAVSENLPVKQQVFERLDAICPPHTILASNSSTYMPTQVGLRAQRADRILVAHYFNPPHILPLVEVVRGPETSDETVASMLALLSGIGKKPALVQKEVPGFIGNRLQIALLREALALVNDGVASAQDVDTVIRYGFGRRLAAAGVFEVFEAAGWDVVSAVYDNLAPHIASSPETSLRLRAMADKGELGLKTLKGFYDWTPESAEALRERIARSLAASERLEREEGAGA